MEKLHVKEPGDGYVYTGEAVINPIFSPRAQHTNFLSSTFERLKALDKDEQTILEGADWTLFCAVAEEMERRDLLPPNWLHYYALDRGI